MNEQTNINVEKLRPFTRLLMTIGELPTSYLMSMTYLEQVTWFCNYLQKTVIPVVNNNAQAVEELQDIINNLDIQDEVNTKLDEMAESGQLADVIAQYLDLAGVLVFDNISDMSDATNITNGSVCYCLGQVTYNDGLGAYYKIRQVTSGDVIDGVNIVALDVSNTLIAEIIPYTKVKPLIQALNTRVDTIQRNAIYIGNSYTAGYGSTGNNNGIFNRTKDMFNNAYAFTGSGTGFIAHTDHENDTFVTQLQRAVADTTIDKNSITDIIIIGAYGDSSAFHEINVNYLDYLISAVTSFTSIAHNNYPNLKRISYTWAEGRQEQNPTMQYLSTLSDEFSVHNMFKFILPRYGIEYLGWIGFNITLNYIYFSSDKLHPNDLGYETLATLFKTAYNGGITYKPIYRKFSYTTDITSNSTINFHATIEPDKWFLSIEGGSIKAGTTHGFNTFDTLIDFTSLEWCLPRPFRTDVYLGDFMLETTKPHESNFNADLKYATKMILVVSSNTLSTKISMQTLSAARTIASDLNAPVYLPNMIFCDLEFKSN